MIKCKLNDKKKYDILSKITFEGVFSLEDIPSNSALANYMSIPSFLADNKSIMLITYGYSGVGKTFTVFGKGTTPGLLQSSLQSITNKERISYRAFDLYGLGFPYKSYWNGKNINKFHHKVFSYIKKDSVLEEVEHLNDTIESYISDTTNYTELQQDDIANFSNIVDEIDDVRTSKGRIKRTPNNIVSSRSIMIYDFKIILDTGNEVSFIILDLPGKENIKETFVNEPPTNQYQCIEYIYNDPSETLALNDEMVRGMAYLSPLSLMLHAPFARRMYNICGKDNYLKEITSYGKTYQKAVDGNYALNLGLLKPNISDKTDIILGLETFRNIILNDDFTNLIKFYNLLFKNKSDYADNAGISDNGKKCTTSENGILAPFEGYYINENISGLLKTLLKYIQNLSSEPLANNIFNIQEDVYLNAIKGMNEDKFQNNASNIQNGESSSYKEYIKDELTAQTYFFRVFARANTIKPNYQFKCFKPSIDTVIDDTQSVKIQRATSAGTRRPSNSAINFSQVEIGSDACPNASLQGNYAGKTLEEWITESYDYDKIYSKDASPIEIILRPYFEKMSNFYIFYVVSNKHPENCEKQINLINNAGPFLNSISKFKKKQT